MALHTLRNVVRDLPSDHCTVERIANVGAVYMHPYDEEHEIACYVWQFYRDFFTAAEKRAYQPYLWQRMKVEKNRDIVDDEWTRSGLAGDAEVMVLLSDGVEAFHRRAARRVLQEHSDAVFLNRCPRCYRLVRTPKARQCLWCGYDWHRTEITTVT